MVYNIFKTIQQGRFVPEEKASAPAIKVQKQEKGGYWHSWIEKRPMQMLFWSTIAILIGGVIEFVPTFLIRSNVPTIAAVKPYTPLELEGRDLYIRENCAVCHSQMIRPFRNETERYGDYSKAGEFVYDRPFLWGSKRTGPDLQREGGKMPDSWHFNHMYDPQSTSPGSIMPPYYWLIENQLNTSLTQRKIEAMQSLGVPYPKGFEKKVHEDMAKQAKGIQENLAKDNIEVKADREIIAIIAYLQRLGTDVKKVDPQYLPKK